MKSGSIKRTQAYQNVMEILVEEEIERRLKQLSPQIAKSINPIEVATYALNRLPPLYASSEKGWKYQKQRGMKELAKQISTVVSRSISAVQKDPIRLSTPLFDSKDPASQQALKRLKKLLLQENLSWWELPRVVEQALIKAWHGEISWKHHEQFFVQVAQHKIPAQSGRTWGMDRYGRW